MDKKDDKIEAYLKCLSGFIVIILSVLLMILLYWTIPFIHESGHIIYGKISNLNNGHNSKFNITNWEPLPILSFLKYPQQTKILVGEPTLLFALGGSLFTILIITIVVYYLYTLSKRKIYWFFVPLFIFHEFFENFLCGTDNFYGKPYNLCKNMIIHHWWVLFFISFILLILLLIYPSLERQIYPMLRNILKNKKHNRSHKQNE